MSRESKEQSSAAVEAGKAAARLMKDILPEAAPTPPNSLKSATSVEKIKQEARKNTAEMKNDSSQAQARMERTTKEVMPITVAKEHLQTAFASPHAKEASWLVTSPTEFQYNADAIQFVSNIAAAPLELQNDPHYLLSEGARLFWSTNWDSLSADARNETQTILNRIYSRVEQLRAANPDFDIQQEVVRHNLEKEKKQEEQKEARSANVGTALFADIRDQLPVDLQKYVDGWTGVLNSTKMSDGADVNLCSSWADFLERRLNGMSNASPEEQIKHAELIELLRGRIRKFNEEDRIPSTIMLIRREVLDILKDPLGYLERMANDIEQIASERGFDSAIIEQRMNRYRLITDYFVSDAYDIEKGIKIEQSVSQKERAELFTRRKNLLRTKADVLDQYTDRLHSIEFTYYLSQVADFEKDTRFGQLLDRISERGAFGTRAQYGGLAEVALHKMKTIHWELLNDPEEVKRSRSLPAMMEEVRRRTAQAMLNEEEIWKPQYQAYLNRLIEGGDGAIPTPEVDWSPSTCDAISRVAEASYMMFFEREQVMIRGLGPGDAQIFTGRFQNFITEGAAEKMAATFRLRDWHFRKWDLLTPGERALWNQRARFYIEKDPELRAWASEKSDLLWRELQHEKESWEGLLAKGDKDSIKSIRDSKTFIKIRVVFSEYEQAKKELKQDQEHDIHFMLHLKKGTLYKYVASDIGGEWAQMQGARCYGFWESGVRRELIEDKLREHPTPGARELIEDKLREHPIFGPMLFPPEAKAGEKQESQSIFLGGAVYKTQRKYFHEAHHPDRARQKFMETLDNALRFRPHFFVKMRQMEMGISMGKPATDILNEAFARFDTIQSKLMLSGEKPIDYSTDFNSWSDGQRAIAREVFDLSSGRNGKPRLMSQEQYLSQMKKYFESFKERSYTGEDNYRKPFKSLEPWESRMGEFTHMRYASAFSFVLWTDDVPISVLENRDVLNMDHINRFQSDEVKQEMKDYRDKKFISLSRHSTEKGYGRAGEWRRAWADFIKAQALMPIQAQLLNIDEKEFAKSLTTLINSVSSYQGSEDGAKSALEAIAGWLGGAKTKQEYTEVLKGLKNSSEMKQWWGDHAKSLGLGEVSEMFDDFELLRGKLGAEFPEFEEATKDFLGITRWRHAAGGLIFGEKGIVTQLFGTETSDKIVEALNERFPNLLYLSKTKYAFGFFVLLLLFFAVDQAKKGTETAEKKSH